MTAILLLSLLLLPASAGEFPDDPVGRRMRQSDEEKAALQAITASQDLMDRLEGVQQRYTQDGDYARYIQERDPLALELEPALRLLMEVRKDVDRTQYSQQMFNVLQLASAARKRTRLKKERDTPEVGARVVEFNRSMQLSEQVAAQKNKLSNFIPREAAFFQAAFDLDRRERRLKAGLAAAALAVCAAAAFLLTRRKTA